MMKRMRKFLRSPKTTVTAFVLAGLLLLFSSIGGTRAALTYFSETYASRVQMSNIGVTLMEKGQHDEKFKPVSKRDYNDASNGTWNENTGALLEGMLEEDEELIPGRKYKEELKVQNTGDIRQYVRVSIYKYWTDGKAEKGKEPVKKPELDPKLIELNLVNIAGQDSGSGKWLLDQGASTKERTVLYYSDVLDAQKETDPFTDTVRIDDNIATKVTQTVTQKGEYTNIKTTYDYDGIGFCVEAKVDAVQDHNAADAIWSAWGRRVSIDNETLSLE